MENTTKTPETTGKNTYAAFYQGKEVEIFADTLWGAKVKAIAHFKVRKSQEHMVGVILTFIDGKVITHSTASL